MNYKGAPKPYGGSDHSSFAKKDIPIFCMFTGIHKDYHKPTDVIEKVNLQKMTEITKLAFLNLWHFANIEEEKVN